METLHQQATELLLIERERLADTGTIAVLGDQDADDAEKLAYAIGMERVHFYTRFYGDEQAYKARGLTATAQWPTDKDENVRSVAVFQSREKEVTELRVAVALEAFPNAQDILLVGHKKLGIKSMPKRFHKDFEEVDILSNARHCTSIRIAKAKTTARRGIDPFWQSWNVSIDGQPLHIQDLPGVFSRGELDRGSHMLIQNMGDLSGKAILDAGCGAGLLSLAAATRYNDCRITAFDHDSLAILSAHKNAQHLGVQDRMTILLGELDNIRNTKFDRIITNPPFHVGSQQSTSITEGWLAQIGKLLKANGQLRLVANRHLPYATPLQDAFKEVQLLDEDAKYKVWLAMKAR